MKVSASLSSIAFFELAQDRSQNWTQQSCYFSERYARADTDIELHTINAVLITKWVILRWDVSHSVEVNENINLGYSQDQGYSYFQG